MASISAVNMSDVLFIAFFLFEFLNSLQIYNIYFKQQRDFRILYAENPYFLTLGKYY